MLPPRFDASDLTTETIRDLLGWRPPLGVLSLYMAADPGDRGGGWQIALRNGLAKVKEETEHADHGTRTAIKATVSRLEREIEESTPPPRGLVAFIEVAEEPAEERSFGSRMRPLRNDVFHSRRPWLAPLIALLDEGGPFGAVAISAERVRLFHCMLGEATELHDWQLELYLDDWRERKAQRPTDPAAAQAVSSSGRDQHDQRMAANRERFAQDTGELTAPIARERGWRRLLAFGDQRYADEFAEGFTGVCELSFVGAADLVSQPANLIADRVYEVWPRYRREQEQALLDHIRDAAYSEGRACYGRPETMQALEQGRVEHLVYDGERNGLETEQMIELAVPTAAAITPVEAEVAEQLGEHGGVAALLRY